MIKQGVLYRLISIIIINMTM